MTFCSCLDESHCLKVIIISSTLSSDFYYFLHFVFAI